MRVNDFVIINKAIQKTAEHETFKQELMKLGVFDFIHQTVESLHDHEDKIDELQKEVKKIKKREKEMRETYLPDQFEEYKKSMADSIIETVNNMNGGPVTEGKVLDMLQNERSTNIKADIDVLAQKVDKLVENEIIKMVDLVDEQGVQIKDAKVFADNMNTMVMKHEQQFEEELLEPEKLTDEQDAMLGLYKKHGMKFDKDSNIVILTKK